MNELRMYVEHLFEGRVLTPENIELKEEIYGNLVARYEDLLADGVDEAEALRRTKDSMASVDDVLDGDASDDDDAGVAALREAAVEEASAADMGDAAALAATGGPADQTEVHTGPTPIVDHGAPAASDSSAARPAGKNRTWVKVAIAALAALAVLGVGFAGCSLLFGLHALDDLNEGQNAAVFTPNGSEGSNPSRGNGANGSGSQPAASAKNREILVDESGQVWLDGEPGDALAEEVVNAGYDTVSQYLDTELSEAAAVEELLHALPLGDYATDIDVTKGVGVLSLAYRELPEMYDGDSVDAALAYDVTAVLCAMPLVNEIQVTVMESDEPLDESYYVFTRDNVQGCYGISLDAEMVNEAGWGQIKEDNLYRRKFIDNMVKAAEREWR